MWYALGMSRGVKRFVYLGGLLAVIALFMSWYIATSQPAPSCKDYIQNQGEEGVDCGKVCGNYCLPQTLRPIESVGVPRVLPLDAGRVSIVARVQNPNAAAARSLPYTLRLSGFNGEELHAQTGSLFLYPNEVRTVGFPAIAVPLLSIGKAELVFGVPDWGAKELFIRPKMVARSQSTTRDERGGFVVQGTIANEDIVAFSAVGILAVLKDASGQPIGVAQTEISGLAPGEVRQFRLIHPALSASADPSATEIVLVARQ